MFIPVHIANPYYCISERHCTISHTPSLPCARTNITHVNSPDQRDILVTRKSLPTVRTKPVTGGAVFTSHTGAMLAKRRASACSILCGYYATRVCVCGGWAAVFNVQTYTRCAFAHAFRRSKEQCFAMVVAMYDDDDRTLRRRTNEMPTFAKLPLFKIKSAHTKPPQKKRDDNSLGRSSSADRSLSLCSCAPLWRNL